MCEKLEIKRYKNKFKMFLNQIKGYFKRIDNESPDSKKDNEFDDLWKILWPNGKTKWERQMSKGLTHGYCRQFNKKGYIQEERHYFKDVLDGWWKNFDEKGRLKNETLFEMGCVLREISYDSDHNVIEDEVRENLASYEIIKDFPHISEDYKVIRKYIKFDPDVLADHSAERIISEFRRTAFKIITAPLSEDSSKSNKSLIGDINLSAQGESWPSANGTPLSPVMQLCISDLAEPPEILKDLDYLMIFIHPEGYYEGDNTENILIRAYKKDSNLVLLQKLPDVIYNPLSVQFEQIDDYPDREDLPPGLREALKLNNEEYEENLYSCYYESKINGWPKWIQSSELSSSYQFVLQIDAYGEPYWDWQDCPVLYIFRHIPTGEFYATTQSC